MKVWHISDTHTYHGLLDIPKDIDTVIFSGDCSNPREVIYNEPQVRSFIKWFDSLPIKHKIFVAGNHDTSIERGYITKENFDFGIHYLENDSICIEGINIWGSPYTPTFGMGWAFNKARHKLHELWVTIPDNTNILISHGPPKGILDLSYNQNNGLERCGCSALYNRCNELKDLKLVCFGHIHNCEDIINAGYMIYENNGTIYSNGSVVTDGKFGKLTSNGNIFDI